MIGVKISAKSESANKKIINWFGLKRRKLNENDNEMIKPYLMKY